MRNRRASRRERGAVTGLRVLLIVVATSTAVTVLCCAGAIVFGPVAWRAHQLPQPEADAVVRTIRVRIACDEEWRRQPRWEALARSRLERASAVFEERFGIRWLGTDVVTWESDDDAGSLEAVADLLARSVAPGDGDIVLGFSGQMRARDAEVDYRLRGWAPYFGRYAIVSTNRWNSSEDWCRGALVHELGHLLGAWHCADPRSVMEASGYRQSTENFDPQAVAVIQLMRDFDFAKGVAWLDEDRRRRMDSIYREGHLKCVELPYVHAEIEGGWRLLRGSADVIGARAAFRRAVDVQEAIVGPDDPSLVEGLRSLAWASLREPVRDVDEAERLMRRTAAITTATNSWVDPPADCDALLGAVSWERGRRGYAVATLRKAYDARVAAIGSRDPHSVELAELLSRYDAQMQAVPAAGSGK